MIKIKRVYEETDINDGQRILVDRLWPRGVKKAKTRIDAWLKDLAPSTALREWFGHKPERWQVFQERYLAELASPEKLSPLEDLISLLQTGTVTLLYAAHDTERNNATVLKNFLEERLAQEARHNAGPTSQ